MLPRNPKTGRIPRAAVQREIARLSGWTLLRDDDHPVGTSPQGHRDYFPAWLSEMGAAMQLLDTHRFVTDIQLDLPDFVHVRMSKRFSDGSVEIEPSGDIMGIGYAQLPLAISCAFVSAVTGETITPGDVEEL